MSDIQLGASPPVAASSGPHEAAVPTRDTSRAAPATEDVTQAPEKVAANLADSERVASQAAQQRRLQAQRAQASEANSTRMDIQVGEDGALVVKVRDARTDKVVREIPPEELVEFGKKMRRYLGVLLDKKG
jgi:flagellar protein FlaG